LADSLKLSVLAAKQNDRNPLIGVCMIILFN
jgi:hypothetical protein